mgnify:FL=1
MKKYNNGNFTLKDENQTVTLYGWVNKIRNFGEMVFIDLRDRSGIIQVVFNKKDLNDSFNDVLSLKNEYCIAVTGVIKKREEINKNLKTGEIELIASSLEIYSTSLDLPFNVYDDKEPSEETLLKYRFLDLRRKKLQNTMILRHNITKAFRDYLNENGFLDFETPILCKSTPEGARDYLVPSRIYKGSFFALPQSPQLFKQILMISGFEKYYQIAKCFRDEDLRSDRQPEFTQVDIEMSFVTREDVLEFSEKLIKYVVEKSTGEIINYKFPRITHKEALDKYGSDKPDTRFEMLLNNISDILIKSNLNIFTNPINDGGLAKCLVVNNNTYSRSDLDKLTDFVKKEGAKGLAWIKYEENEFTGPIVKNIDEDILKELKDKLNIKNNDLILIVADTKKVVNETLGRLRLKIAKDYNLIDENKYNFLFVTDFPMFEYSVTEKRYVAAHHPFTMPESASKLNDKENCLSLSYDMVLNGYEIAGGSIRIHDEKTQSEVFKALGINKEEADLKFGFFLDALKYGTPPHGGIAFGLDRVVMLLAKTNNIKDVVAFPKTQTTSDLMTNAPSTVSKLQLDELGINIKEDLND